MPGSTMTETFLQVTPPERLEMHAHHTPLGHLGRPEDIANAVLFLASDESAMITGQEFSVDGGMMIVPPYWHESKQTVAPTDTFVADRKL
jgi:3-oxoacyl-[acyl-carrier protein] reductase